MNNSALLLQDQPILHRLLTNRVSRGFSLVELLTVVAMISVLAVLVTPAVTGILQADTANQAIDAISGQFERAREHAMAKNTYVWVAFTSDSDESVKMAAFESRDGTESPVLDDADGGFTPGAYSGTAASLDGADAPVRLLYRVEELEGIKLQSGSQAIPSVASTLRDKIDALNLVRDLDSLAGEGGSPGPIFEMTQKGENLRFSRAVTFTPLGQARISPAFSITGASPGVQVVVIPRVSKAPGAPLKESNPGAILVTGVTSRVAVYRP